MQATILVLVMAAQAPAASPATPAATPAPAATQPPAAAPPQNPPHSRLIELPRLRPTRADNARENLALDAADRRGPEPEPAAIAEPAPEELAPPAPAPLPPPAAPAPLMAPVAPVAPPAAAAARGGAGFDPRLLAPLTALVGPVIGALWLVSRRGIGTPAE